MNQIYQLTEAGENFPDCVMLWTAEQCILKTCEAANEMLGADVVEKMLSESETYARASTMIGFGFGFGGTEATFHPNS